MEGTARIARGSRSPAAGRLLLAAVLAVIALAPTPAARAQSGLVLDPSWAGGAFGHDAAYGDQGPRAIASGAQHAWVLSNRAGATSGAVLQQRRPDGTSDPGFAGGEVAIDVGAPAGVAPYGWDVVALPDGDVAVLTDVVQTGSSDVGLEVLRPDGAPDPAYFGGDGRTVIAGPGIDSPMRLAYDAAAQRFLVTGQSVASQGAVADTFVAAVTHGGAPDAGFGTAGFRLFDGGAAAATDGTDFGDALVPLGGGRVAVWYRWNAGGSFFAPDPRTGLRVLDATGADDPSFSGDGDLQTPALTYGRDLALAGGALVGVGSRTIGGASTESMALRVGLDGGGLTQTPIDLVPGESETLDQLVAVPGALLVAGERRTRINGPLQRLAIAARLSPATFQPLERGLLEVPGAREGYRDVAAAPGVPGGLLLATYVTPHDTALFRAIPGTPPAGGAGTGPGLGDGAPGAGRPGADLTAPRIRRLTATPVIRLGRGLPAVAAGVAPGFGFSLSERATVTLAFEARRGGRWRALRGARVVLRGVRAGARRVRFAGRLSRRRALAPGRYRVVVRASDAAGNVSAPVRGAFRLVR